MKRSMKHISIVALMLNLGVAGVYAQSSGFRNIVTFAREFSTAWMRFALARKK